MFYSLSKIFWLLVSPLSVIGFLIVAAAAALWVGWRRTGLWLTTIAAGLVLFAATVPLGAYATLALENRFPANPPLPADVDGIIVLGGPVDPVATLARNQPAVGGSFDRVLVFADLADRYPEAKLVYTGGRHLAETGPGEAAVMPAILRRLNVDPSRVILESDSRNTYQNAVYSHSLAAPGDDEAWVLVTSASHMPRAMGTFRQAGWPASLIAYPTDFQFLPDAKPAWFQFRLGGGLGQLGRAMHEAVGLTAYYLTGRSEALFPGPVTADIENAGQP